MDDPIAAILMLVGFALLVFFLVYDNRKGQSSTSPSTANDDEHIKEHAVEPNFPLSEETVVSPPVAIQDRGNDDQAYKAPSATDMVDAIEVPQKEPEAFENETSTEPGSFPKKPTAVVAPSAKKYVDLRNLKE